MILMIQREHFAHQNVSWFDMCHTLNKICPFIRFGSNDMSVWRRNAEENTPTTTITANNLIATFGLGWRINLAFCFYCILYVVESIADYCYEHRVYVGDFSCLFSHCHLICFCVRLICTNGVNFDRNCFSLLFIFGLFSFSLFLYCLFAHTECILNAYFWFTNFLNNWTLNFSIFSIYLVVQFIVILRVSKTEQYQNDITKMFGGMQQCTDWLRFYFCMKRLLATIITAFDIMKLDDWQKVERENIGKHSWQCQCSHSHSTRNILFIY